jgi:hypothetical protein
MYLCAWVFISLLAIGPALPARWAQAKGNVDKPSHLDLIRKVFPDATKELSAENSVVIRHIRGDYDPDKLTGPMRIYEEGCYTVVNGTHHDCVLALDISHTGAPTNPWGGETLLALFRMQPNPHLLDVADIQMDRESGVWSKPAILHGGNHDALVTYYCHLNASEEYMAPALVEIVQDKFVQSRAELPMAFSARTATAEIVESPSFVLTPKSTGPVIFRMKMVGKKLDEDTHEALKCESKIFSFSLIQKNGRWHCISDAQPCKFMGQMQERFGFAQ